MQYYGGCHTVMLLLQFPAMTWHDMTASSLQQFLVASHCHLCSRCVDMSFVSCFKTSNWRAGANETNLDRIPTLYKMACHISGCSPHNHYPNIMPWHSWRCVAIHQVCQEPNKEASKSFMCNLSCKNCWTVTVVRKTQVHGQWNVCYLGKARPGLWSPSQWSWCSPCQANTWPCHSVCSGWYHWSRPLPRKQRVHPHL